MKKIITLIAISLLLTACGQKDSIPATDTATQTGETIQEEQATSEVEAKEETLEEEAAGKESTQAEVTDEPTSEDTAPDTAEPITATGVTESPEELVDDFGDELESLFDLIEDGE